MTTTITSEYTNIIYSHLPSGSKITSKCVEMNCPCCIYMGEKRQDTRRRGGFFNNGNEIGYNCFNCGYKFRADDSSELPFKAIKLLELLNVPKSEVNKLHFLSLKLNPIKRNLGSTVSSNSFNKPINLNFKNVDLPKGTVLLHDYLEENDCDPESDAFQAYIYAKSRGIGDYPYLLWSPSKEYKINKRLIIPYMYNDNVVGYTARLFIKEQNKSERYINNNPNQNYVFNIDTLFRKDRKIVIINESVLDSILYDGVGLMGAYPNVDQCNIVNSFKGRKILVPDLNIAGLKSVETAIKNGWEVFFPSWSYGFDLGEAVQHFGKIFVLESIINDSIKDPLEIKVKKNLLNI